MHGLGLAGPAQGGGEPSAFVTSLPTTALPTSFVSPLESASIASLAWKNPSVAPQRRSRTCVPTSRFTHFTMFSSVGPSRVMSLSLRVSFTWKSVSLLVSSFALPWQCP